MQSAMTALVLRRVLLDEAARLDISGDNDEATIDALLEQETRAPVPDEPTCRRYSEQHTDRYTVGQLLEVDHILFQVTPLVDLVALRALAQDTLNLLIDRKSVV